MGPYVVPRKVIRPNKSLTYHLVGVLTSSVPRNVVGTFDILSSEVHIRFRGYSSESPARIGVVLLPPSHTARCPSIAIHNMHRLVYPLHKCAGHTMITHMVYTMKRHKQVFAREFVLGHSRRKVQEFRWSFFTQ
jgi:hypothetical protein